MNQPVRTEEVLKRASAHLHYELWMLTCTANGLGSGIATGGWLSNALLESFVVHVRSLSDFLYAEAKKPDDVLAGDYLPTGQWVKVRPPESELLKRARVRAHKEIVHLTYERLNVTPDTKPWAFVEIAKAIHSVFEVFSQHVPKHLLSEEWTRGQAS
jgi:hypothetical protein